MSLDSLYKSNYCNSTQVETITVKQQQQQQKLWERGMNIISGSSSGCIVDDIRLARSYESAEKIRTNNVIRIFSTQTK